MSYVRVTQSLMVNRVLDGLGRQTRKVLDLQEQLSTGLRVNAPSEDPIASRLAIDTRAAISKNEQYQTNMEAAAPFLSASEAAIHIAVENTNRAQTLAQQGASGTYNQAQRDSIAVEINQILEGMLSTGNTQTNGRFLFGGSRTMNEPFTATRNAAGEITAVTYEGNGEHMQVEVADGMFLDTNESGADVFQSGEDIFAALITLRDSLRTGDQETIRNTSIGALDNARGQLMLSTSRLGAIQNRMDRATEDVEGAVVQYKELLSKTIEADYAETLISLNAQSNAYTAALNSAARVIQPSLLDFIS